MKLQSRSQNLTNVISSLCLRRTKEQSDHCPKLRKAVMMRRSVILLAACAMLATAATASDITPIQNALLDDRVVYTVPVSTNRVTTISFPGPISAIDAAGVTTDAKIPGLFQLAHTKGSAFLSVQI